jgi:hypothetical protein
MSFCVNWAFLIARGTRLKHELSEGFKASRAIRKAQFTQKRVVYKMLLFFSNTNILYCFHGAFELTPYVSHKIRLSL